MSKKRKLVILLAALLAACLFAAAWVARAGRVIGSLSAREDMSSCTTGGYTAGARTISAPPTAAACSAG